MGKFLDSSKAQTMDPLCPDDETDSEFQQFIEDQIDTIPQDFEELKNGTLPNVADSSDPVFAHNEDSSMLPQVIQHQLAKLLENFDEFEKTMLHPYEMDPMNSQNLSEWNFARANQDKNMIIQDGTQKEGQFLVEGTHNFTENMDGISYMSHGSSGGGCISEGSEVAGPFVKCANEISYGGCGGAVRSFTKYGFLVQYGNGMNVWRWMGGSATTTRARAKKKKRKYKGQFETETAAAARHEHQKIKNRAAAAQSFQQKQVISQLMKSSYTHIQKLRKENEFHKKLLTVLESAMRVDKPQKPLKRTISAPM
ncbi:hypothetical protein LOK49_LG09G00013 [Camellia lanceoleosa]|uniref:Uncharacterized protein n=1 Tax=Camellia lanceoleosa TaxID=1840588 RepID=A0ACC0GKZ6_9ERIC|nr:hypothetical protein LOK49_LG09G00013 [Camellia lanceoleosa]